MKKNFSVIASLALLALFLPLAANAATQVYDLKADWSDTQNPNETWSYRNYVGGLLVNDPFPWVDGAFVNDAITKATAASVVPGYLELGDVFIPTMTSGLTVRWTAPANGTINISGGTWYGGAGGVCDVDTGKCFSWIEWTLTQNGSILSSEYATGGPRATPYDFSSGLGGADALHNISVHADDQIEVTFLPLVAGTVGLNFTITLTPDSVDPVTAIEDLAITVFDMNLQNGIENSLDSKLDAALNALSDVNVNNDGVACNSLSSFVNAVEAQRGNKLTSEQADQLIASAQDIQTSLNCGN